MNVKIGNLKSLPALNCLSIVCMSGPLSVHTLICAVIDHYETLCVQLYLGLVIEFFSLRSNHSEDLGERH